MSVTIAAQSIPNWQRDSDVVLRIYALNSFVASDGTEVVAGDASVDSETNGNWFTSVACTVSPGVLSIPQVVLPSTTDSPDNPKAAYAAIFFTAEGDFISPFGQFARFTLTPTPASTTWKAIAALGAASGGSSAPAYFFAGAWDASKGYGLANIVSHSNALWYALSPSSGETPGSDSGWTLMLQSAPGTPGPPGPPGPLAAGTFSPQAFSVSVGIPQSENVCDLTQLAVGFTRNPADGTLVPSTQGANRITTGLMRAFEVKRIVTNAPVRMNSDCNTCLYDGSGAFMRVQAMPVAASGNGTQPINTPFELDGDQSYVSCSWDTRNYNGLTTPEVMFFVGTDANPPSMPSNGEFVSFDYIGNKITAATEPLARNTTLTAAVAAQLPVQFGVNLFDYKRSCRASASRPMARCSKPST